MQENNNSQPLMVSIKCITYNHEPYIRQCLEGFVMQKTNFRFEAVVHDDASTDGTADIIREYAEKYPDIIKPIYETENQYSKKDGSLGRIMDAACTGKYIAMCEGDDYWTDPSKLQKQVDILESNPEVGLVRTNCDMLYQRTQKIKKAVMSNEYYSSIKNTYQDQIYNAKWVATCTWVYRNNIDIERVILDYKLDRKKYFLGDLFLLLCVLKSSTVAYLNQTTSVYRVVDLSASHFKTFKESLSFFLSVARTRVFFAKDIGFVFVVRVKIKICLQVVGMIISKIRQDILK